MKPLSEWTTDELSNALVGREYEFVHLDRMASILAELLRRERERCAAVADGWTAHDGREDESPAQVAAGIADRIRGLQ